MLDFETREQFNEIKKKVDLLQQSVDRLSAYLGVSGQVTDKSNQEASGVKFRLFGFGDHSDSTLELRQGGDQRYHGPYGTLAGRRRRCQRTRVGSTTIGPRGTTRGRSSAGSGPTSQTWRSYHER